MIPNPSQTLTDNAICCRQVQSSCCEAPLHNRWRSRFDIIANNSSRSHFSSKRTVDFGLSRGYSGAQEAKHRMAMQIANFAGGPGRRKRLSGGKLAALN